MIEIHKLISDHNELKLFLIQLKSLCLKQPNKNPPNMTLEDAGRMIQDGGGGSVCTDAALHLDQLELTHSDSKMSSLSRKFYMYIDRILDRASA